MPKLSQSTIAILAANELDAAAFCEDVGFVRSGGVELLLSESFMGQTIEQLDAGWRNYVEECMKCAN